MKILFVNHENNLGGATRSMLGIIDQLLLNSDNKILVFIPKFNEDTKQGKLCDELERRNVPYIHERSYWWMYPKSNKMSLKKRFIDYAKVVITYLTSLKVSKIVKKKNIEIIHSNSSVTCLGAFVANRVKCKHIWHIREFGLEDHGLAFVMSDKRSIAFMKKSAGKFICISNSIYQKYASILDSRKCHMVYNGLDIDLPFKETRKRVDCSYKLLISGRIKESKGQYQALEALRILKEKGFVNLKLYIAGICYDDYIIKLQKYIDENNLSSNVIFCNFVNDMRQLREDIDIELVCSKMEAFGRVTIEAMLNSNPVVGANSGGTKELIQDGKTGLLYQQGNSIDLAFKIENLLMNYELRENIAKNAFGYAKMNYTSITNARKIVGIYQELLQ